MVPDDDDVAEQLLKSQRNKLQSLLPGCESGERAKQGRPELT